MIDEPPPQAALVAVAARYGVPPHEVAQVPGGVANHSFRLGPHLFLRVPRRGEEFLADLRKEAMVIPLARQAGVRTPAIVDFDESRTLVDSPYMVLERVPAPDLAQLDLRGDARAKALRELGRELALLHRIRRDSAGVPDGLPEDDLGDPFGEVDRMARDGYLDRGTADWLTDWFGRLGRRFPTEPEKVLLHGDVAPQNMLVDPADGTLRGVVDWGDACWAEPGMEFAKLSLFDVVTVLEGYREQSASWTDDGLEARILWYHLSWGLASAVRGRPQPDARHWTAPPVSRLLNVLRFFAASPPPRWAALS
ncbi:phosphotransferase family protein [Kitasatospora viridis]|uniref:Phosphotransferase family enzyme n=1 Tax=Kitasatospora viridis TaxID=281105 RepID=A0A561SDU7_9ACTN|nr:phosphotransferase [Kitasatospora viridis]TWF73042.1 phosphotransferase family enzyme [Kitasatospora viridis]